MNIFGKSRQPGIKRVTTDKQAQACLKGIPYSKLAALMVDLIDQWQSANGYDEKLHASDVIKTELFLSMIEDE